MKKKILDIGMNLQDYEARLQKLGNGE